MTTPRVLSGAGDETLVDLRCSVVVIHQDNFLLIQRTGQRGDWVLPGGRPRHGESMQSCARRETFEETGLRVNPTRCAFVSEVIEPDDAQRVVELVFLASIDGDPAAVGTGEPGAIPTWVSADQLRHVRLRPPIAGYLPSLLHGRTNTAAYLGNLWRPPHTSDQPRDAP